MLRKLYWIILSLFIGVILFQNCAEKNLIVPNSNAINSSTSSVQVVGGFVNGCLLKGGGLWCWGNNEFGQVGNGTDGLGTDVQVPTKVSGLTTGVESVAVGTRNVCAVKSGALFCWGFNGYGQLGRGDTDYSANSAPLAVNSMYEGVTQVSIGLYTVCAIKSGALYCWGNNGYGQVGDGTTAQRTNPVAVSGMDRGVTFVANNKNGTDYWGAGRLCLPFSRDCFGHTCAIKEGALYCWGYNQWGQLGNGTAITGINGGINTYVPKMVSGMDSGVTDVAVGDYSTCAIKNWSVYCWGRNTQGELGLGDSVNRFAPIKVEGPLAGKKIVKVKAGSQTYCATTDGGAIYCWGYNNLGQVGTGNTLNQNQPVLLAGFDAAVTSFDLSAFSAFLIVNNQFFSWGSNSYAELANGTVGGNLTTPTLAIPDLNNLQ